MVDNSNKDADSTREGGREATKSLTSGLSGGSAPPTAKPRNSSGNASTAASILDLRMRLMRLETAVLESGLLSDDAVRELTRERQRGYRSQR